jgi:hypothetical protein
VDINIHLPEFSDMGKGIKAHVVRNKSKYAFVAGVGVTGVAWYFTGGRGFGQGNVTVRALNLFSNHPNITTVIESGRQGPPSWVVRCRETGEVFVSQRAASIGKGIAEANISKHLNGFQDSAEGLHFERICLAA